MSARCWDGAAAAPMIGGLMAHIQKYKAHSVGHMLAHYRRDPSSLERDNIDPTRTGRNVTFGRVRVEDEHGRPMLNDAGKERWRVQPVDWKPNWDTVSARIERVNADARAEGRRVTRKDAVVMADLVLTLPQNVPVEDGDRFFELSYEFFAGKVGAENLMGGFVHRDEMRTKKDKETGKTVRTGERVRDHIHVPWTPILDGRFNFKQQCPRTFYKTLHRELGDYLEAQMGYRPDIELSEEQRGEKALSEVKNKDVEATRAALARKEERLECLQGQIEEMEPLAVTFGESARTLVEHRGDGGREREAVGYNEQLKGGVAELEQQVRAARERAGELERGNRQLEERLRDVRGRHQQLGERFENLERRMTAVLQALREVPNTLGAWALDIANRLGKRTYDPRSLDRVEGYARAASVAGDLSRSRGWDDQSRRCGQER